MIQVWAQFFDKETLREKSERLCMTRVHDTPSGELEFSVSDDGAISFGSCNDIRKITIVTDSVSAD